MRPAQVFALVAVVMATAPDLRGQLPYPNPTPLPTPTPIYDPTQPVRPGVYQPVPAPTRTPSILIDPTQLPVRPPTPIPEATPPATGDLRPVVPTSAPPVTFQPVPALQGRSLEELVAELERLKTYERELTALVKARQAALDERIRKIGVTPGTEAVPPLPVPGIPASTVRR